MNLTDEQLRAALTQAGDEIEADRLRPLDLRLGRTPQRTAPNWTGRWRRSRWLQGLAAAAAVTAVAVAATAIATGPASHRRDGGAPSPVSPSAQAHAGGVPPYYVAMLASSTSLSLTTTVRDTRTGAVLATPTPPKGFWFIDAWPGPNSDSFVLEANEHSGPPGLYLLRFNPAGRSTSLTRLRIPATIYTRGLAVSPSGAELAVASGTNTGKVPSKLQIYTLSGRLVRQWQSPGTICLGWIPCPSWSSSGYLAFGWSNNGTNVAQEGVRLIPQTAAGASLLGASRVVLPLKTVIGSGIVLSGNGARIASGVLFYPRPRTFDSALEVFSAITGKLIGRYWTSRPDVIGTGTVFWSNWTGTELLARAQFPQNSRNPQWLLGILAQGRFSPLPTPAGSWAAFAF